MSDKELKISIDVQEPVKGKDYFTQEDQEAIVSEVLALIPRPEDGKDGKDAVVDYGRLETFVREEVAKIEMPEAKEPVPVDIQSIVSSVLALIPEQEEIVVDYPGIKQYCLDEIAKINEEQAGRYRLLNSGGPTTRLGELVDVDAASVTVGQVLSWNGTQWVATNQSGGGGSFGTDNQIPYVNAAGTDFDYSSNLTFDGDILNIGNSAYAVGAGEMYMENTNLILDGGTIDVGTGAFTVSATGAATALSYTKTGGTSSQFLKADGSVSTISRSCQLYGDFRSLYRQSTTWILVNLDKSPLSYPSGFTINSWSLDCSVDSPTTQILGDLMYCDGQAGGAFPGANPTLVVAIDSTGGNSGEASCSYVIPAGKILYLSFDANPTDYSTNWNLVVNFT